MPQDRNIFEGSPDSFGWLRRPELDRPEGLAWETPAGNVMFHRRDAGALRVRRNDRSAAVQPSLTSEHFVSQTTLTAMVLHAARISAPAIEAITLRFAKPNRDGINWTLADFVHGLADYDSARAAIIEAVSIYRLFWIMVPDGDSRDQDARPLATKGLSRLLAQSLWGTMERENLPRDTTASGLCASSCAARMQALFFTGSQFTPEMPRPIMSVLSTLWSLWKRVARRP